MQTYSEEGARSPQTFGEDQVVATCDVRELRASQVLSKWESRGVATGRCRDVMFMDVEHRHAGARRLDLGTADGTWGFDLASTRPPAQSDI